MPNSNNSINVYGVDWCGDTIYTLKHLDELGVPYEYINIEQQPEAADWVKQQNHGKQKTPTVDVSGQILVEPDNDELDEALRSKGLMQ